MKFEVRYSNSATDGDWRPYKRYREVTVAQKQARLLRKEYTSSSFKIFWDPEIKPQPTDRSLVMDLIKELS